MNLQTQQSVIQVNNLSKYYKNTAAVKNLTFSVKQGEIFGFLGPNGAGKTTTIKAMLGLIYPNQGTVSINGHNILQHGKHIKKNIGYLPEKVAFYNNLTALQNLNFYAELKNIPQHECTHLIKEMGLAEHLHKKVGEYSKGMIQRLGMARALLGKPSIIILDEPTSGLDPRGVKLIRSKIKELNSNGATIFISSHILSEIQAVCSQVGIIKKGLLVAQDSVSSLGKQSAIQPKIFIEVENMNQSIQNTIQQIQGLSNLEIRGKTVEVTCEPELRAKVIVEITKAGGNIVNLWTKETSLEDVFMKFTEE